MWTTFDAADSTGSSMGIGSSPNRLRTYSFVQYRGGPPVVIALFRIRRRRLPRLDAAAFLVLWGLPIVAIEHASFGRSGFSRE